MFLADYQKFLAGVVGLVWFGLILFDQVSLRGASAKEITRDALLQKVSQERELRHYAKRASAAAIFIQVPHKYYYYLVLNHFLVLVATVWLPGEKKKKRLRKGKKDN